MTRLASPGLHKLPRGLVTEYVPWSGGSRWADVEKRIRQVWAEEGAAGPGGFDGASASVEGTGDGTKEKSKVLIFCNRGTTVEALGQYLEGRGVSNVALTSRGTIRRRGNNSHLDGFMKKPSASKAILNLKPLPWSQINSLRMQGENPPHVLITTSLLSRGLDFSPSIRHVLIPEPPRNMIDFLHRAGRSGRAGAWGRVVVFVKARGRGSLRGKEVRRAVGGLKRTGSDGYVGGSGSGSGVGPVLDVEWDGGSVWKDEGSERGREFAKGRDGTKVRPPLEAVADGLGGERVGVADGDRLRA